MRWRLPGRRSLAKALLLFALILTVPIDDAEAQQVADSEVTRLEESGLQCALIAHQVANGAAPAPLDACLDTYLKQLRSVPPAYQYNLALKTFFDFPCFGIGGHKDRLAQHMIGVAQELGNFDAAIMAVYNRGVCYWNDKPARFEMAFEKFRPFRDSLAPYVDPSVLDSPEEIDREAFVFRDAARKYVRFLENANRRDPSRRLCGTTPNRCAEDAWSLTQRLKSRLFHSRMLQVLAANDSSGELLRLLARQHRLIQVQESIRLGLRTFFSEGSGDPATFAREAMEVDQEIRQRFPTYSEFYASLTPRLDELRASLADDEIYVSFLILDRHGVLAFRLTKRDAPLFLRLDTHPHAFKAQIADINEDVLEGPPSEAMAPLLEEVGTLLFSQLRITPGARLLIEADEELSSLPFGLLRLNGTPLYARHRITYVPSAGLFQRLRRGSASPRGELYVGFGRSTFPAGETPLPQVKTELAEGSSAFAASTAAAEPEAQESTIYGHAEALRRAHVLHLATHMLSEDGVPYLLFHKGGGEDGRLTEHDVLTRLRTSADLVVLSGCDTATLNKGGDVPGEAFSAITRAFFAAGAKKLLVTQWLVNDDYAGPFVQHFMRDYAAHGDANRALAASQAAVRAMPGALERDWAGWILIGD